MEQMRAAIPAVPKDNILVAQPELAKMLKAAGWLDKLGIEMLVCGSVKETVTALSKQEVALILVGLKLADGTGFEVAEYVRQSEQLAATPIMLVAGAGASDQDVHRGFEMGAVEVLTMPVNLDLLRAKIQSLLNQFRQIRTLKQQFGEINRLKQEVATTRQRLQDIETELDRLAGTAI
jgi:DNA-binding response OmpR family regulator